MGVLDFASLVYLLMDHGFCDPCFRFFNVLHEEGAPQTHGATVVQWCSVVYGFTGLNPVKLQDWCFISRDQQWPDANDAGMETQTAMICPPSSPSSPSGFLQAPSGRTDFSKVGKESKNQDDGRRLCKAGRLPLLPDWLVRGLAVRIGITRL